MAKIRTLKGEFFRNADVSKAGFTAKLLAAGLVLAVADDRGRFKAAPNYLLGEVFTHDQVTTSDVQTALEHLDAVDFIRLYSVNGRVFGALSTWNEHQRIPPTHFKESKLPPPPNTRRRRQTPSLLRQMSVPVSTERKGEEGSGKERKGRGEERDSLSPNGDPVARIFECWRLSLGKTGRTVLTPQRRKAIVGALKDYPEEDLLDAVEGWVFIPHNRGENDRHRPFNDIELLLRDAKHIETFRDAKRGQLTTSGPVHKLDAWASGILEEGRRGPE